LASGEGIDAEAILLTSQDSAATSGPIDSTGNDAAGGQLVGQTVAEVERNLIIDTLDHCLGNRTHAANILGISIRTLRNKLKQYGDEGFNIPSPGEGSRAGA
jgi:two-component system response regulator FlrC